MNIQEFVDYRKKCPICDAILSTFFHSNRRQQLKYENGRLAFYFNLDARKRKQKSYKVAYSFDTIDNSFCVDFYTKEGRQYQKEVPIFLRDRFLDLHNNLGLFKFLKECLSCGKYYYRSNSFNFDFRKTVLQSMEIQLEAVGLTHFLPDEDEVRIFQLYNYFLEKSTMLIIFKGQEDDAKLGLSRPISPTEIHNLPTVPFVSKEETLNRLNNLIIYT